MNFSSPVFLFLFLPLTFACYFSVPQRSRNFILLFWSLLFYGYGAPKVLPLLLLSIFLDYRLSLLFRSKDGKKRASVFALSVLLNLGILFYFKYFNFFLSELRGLVENFGLSWSPFAEVILPIGVSFFVFQKISYLADVYTLRTITADSLINYALYVVLFPQLIAGPIVRYHDIHEQLRNRTLNARSTFEGIERFCRGLAKKVLLADPLGEVAHLAFAQEGVPLTMPFAWVGLLCYAMQIFFDFSGYSDMAIGLGRVFGFRFPENFKRPYLSKSITEFWHRWHITLSNWMRDYLYIPLGGNRCGTPRMFLNLWITFLLSGLWHGAEWTFVLWGAYHGFFLTLERVVKSLRFSLPQTLSWALSFTVVLFSWVLFRASSLSQAKHYFARLFGASAPSTHGLEVVSSYQWATLALACLVCFLPRPPLVRLLTRLVGPLEEAIDLRFIALGLLYLFSVLAIAASDFHPFIYFRF